MGNLREHIAKGQLEQAIDAVNTALSEGISAEVLIFDNLVKGMEEIGQMFEQGKAFVPNLLLSARAMKGCMEILKPLLKNESESTNGTIVIGTVCGDLHDIGKNLVASMLEGCGFTVYNLGVNVTAEQFVAAAKQHNADIICMSALLTTTMEYMRTVISQVRVSDLNGKVRIMVGGAPLDSDYAEKIGADGYSSNANEAVALAKKLLA